MKIASNKLSELLKYYQSELPNIYDKEEIYAIFEIVCEHFLNYSKTEVVTNLNNNINQSDLITIYNTCNELKTGKPIQYILKEAFFYDYNFYVNTGVLIPRPETEELVDLIIKSNNTQSHLNIIDLGTGSGCIPITIKKHLPNSIVYGADISEKALEISNYNSIKHSVDVNFFHFDILNATTINNQQFDIIISNPPYINITEKVEMEKWVLEFEPSLALFVDEADTIIFYKKIIDLCSNSLAKNGYIYFELNPLYAHDVEQYAMNSKLFISCEIIKDMSGKKRFLKAKKLAQ